MPGRAGWLKSKLSGPAGALALLLAACALWLYVWAAEAAASSATQRELNEAGEAVRDVEGRIAEESFLLDSLRQELRELRDEIFALDIEIESVAADIDSAKEAIALLGESMEIVARERDAQTEAMEIARRRKDEAQEVLAARVRAMHENGQINIFEVMMNSESIRDFLVRLDDLQTVIRFNRVLLERLAAYEEEYQSSVDALFLSEGRLEDLRRSSQMHQDSLEWLFLELNAQIAQKHEFMERLEEDERLMEAFLDLLEEEHLAMQARLGAAQARFDRESAAASMRSNQQMRQPAWAPPVTGAGGVTQAEINRSIIERITPFQTRVHQFDGVFLWPVPGIEYMLAGFGQWATTFGLVDWHHTGVDIMAPSGHRIVAADSGVVTFAGWHTFLGNTVIIDHGNGYATVYGHNLRNRVGEGQRVDRGQHIADVGSTGGGTMFDHLHFEVLQNGAHVDPMRYFGR